MLLTSVDHYRAIALLSQSVSQSVNQSRDFYVVPFVVSVVHGRDYKPSLHVHCRQILVKVLISSAVLQL